jgi:hypothetical protein
LGQVGQKLFFDFTNGVTFDQARYTRDLLNLELIAEEKERLTSEEDAFDKLFGNLPSESETLDPAEVEGVQELDPRDQATVNALRQ